MFWMKCCDWMIKKSFIYVLLPKAPRPGRSGQRRFCIDLMCAGLLSGSFVQLGCCGLLSDLFLERRSPSELFGFFRYLSFGIAIKVSVCLSWTATQAETSSGSVERGYLLRICQFYVVCEFRGVI